MDFLPPLPGQLPWPVPDPRARYFVADYAQMHDLVADPVPPVHAPAYIISVFETARELVRHSYYRYECTTIAISVSLFALERAFSEHLGVKKPFQKMVEHASNKGIITAELAGRLDAGRNLRNKLAHGDLTDTALTPALAVAMVKAAFDSAELLFPAPPDGPL
ncbi:MULTISPECIES: hypothetical protein [Streptomyces]|uniref:hypothetical protein n=1 Tax=Streptomyces TaxID=1883 RepID=UPI000FD63DF1|nr:hypothetical protein [Streptomyces sp. B29(2018)]